MTSGTIENIANKGERIAKRMARAGLCSRRDAERWIEQGRVFVNGIKLQTPACVVTESDEIRVDGKPLPAPKDTRLFLYHKPSGLVTTARDEMGRTTVFETLPKEMGRVVSIGRLDLNSEGLLLLTNDGELARHLELPSTGWKRKYRVRVMGTVDPGRLEKLGNGIIIEGVRYKSIDAKIEGGEQKSANTWLQVTLTEGKNREIRRVMEALGLSVNRLIRTAYGPFNLGTLTPGSIEEVYPDVLRHQVGGFFRDKS
ncbi:MAG: pseudouridine synthase [Alphaproteobacteria bacterium]